MPERHGEGGKEIRTQKVCSVPTTLGCPPTDAGMAYVTGFLELLWVVGGEENLPWPSPKPGRNSGERSLRNLEDWFPFHLTELGSARKRETCSVCV